MTCIIEIGLFTDKLSDPKVICKVNNNHGLLYKIIQSSIKGVISNVHIQNDILHNPTGTSVNFQCHYKVEESDKVKVSTSNLVDMYLWYREGLLHREGFPAVIISRNYQNLHEEVWVNGANPKLKLEDNSEPENKMSKSNCKECKNSFNTSTLNKYDGYCCRCSKKVREDHSVTQPVTTLQQTPPTPVESKSTKKKIPDRLRQEVWENNIGDKFWGNCFTCNMRLCAFEFSCGHVVSEAEGGPTVLDNLKVVCKSCNSKMGTQNMIKFKEHRYSSSSSQTEENSTKELQQTGVSYVNRVRRTSTLVDPITDIRDFTGNREFNLSGGVRPMKQFSKIPVDKPLRTMSKFSG
jgi:5-methylcytosine-specific restriction endonuclease McrA